MVVVKFLGLMRSMVGKGELNMKIAEDMTVHQLIENIARVHGQKLGQLLNSATVVVNGKEVIDRKTFQLHDDDIILMVPVIAGG